jgi:hypothetical protein
VRGRINPRPSSPGGRSTERIPRPGQYTGSSAGTSVLAHRGGPLGLLVRVLYRACVRWSSVARAGGRRGCAGETAPSVRKNKNGWPGGRGTGRVTAVWCAREPYGRSHRATCLPSHR